MTTVFGPNLGVTCLIVITIGVAAWGGGGGGSKNLASMGDKYFSNKHFDMHFSLGFSV